MSIKVVNGRVFRRTTHSKSLGTRAALLPTFASVRSSAMEAEETHVSHNGFDDAIILMKPEVAEAEDDALLLKPAPPSPRPLPPLPQTAYTGTFRAAERQVLVP